MIKIFKLLLISLFVNHSMPNEGSSIAEFVSAKDGDTINYRLAGDSKIRVGRLAFIDCPELKQDYGDIALAYTFLELSKDKAFVCTIKKKDLYNRDLIVVEYSGGNLNNNLVRLGLAWIPCSIKNKQIKDLESWARNCRVGLWSKDNPVEPWNYRKLEKIKKCS